MEWVCVGLFFTLAGMLAWCLYLLTQVDQRQGRLDSTQREIEWVKSNCPDEWAQISAAIMRNNI